MGDGRRAAGHFYRTFAFDTAPPAGEGPSSGSGEWSLRFVGKEGIAYEAAAIVDESALTIDAVVGGSRNLVGGDLPLEVRLKVDGKPFTGETKVRASVLASEVGVGTLLATTAPQARTASMPAGAEPGATVGQRRLEQLQSDPDAWEKLAPRAHQVTLVSAADGVFRGSCGPLAVPGALTVVFDIAACLRVSGFWCW